MRLLETQVRLGWSKMAHSHMWYLVLVDLEGLTEMIVSAPLGLSSSSRLDQASSHGSLKAAFQGSGSCKAS